jgi:hypothetical protein
MIKDIGLSVIVGMSVGLDRQDIVHGLRFGFFFFIGTLLYRIIVRIYREIA